MRAVSADMNANVLVCVVKISQSKRQKGRDGTYHRSDRKFPTFETFQIFQNLPREVHVFERLADVSKQDFSCGRQNQFAGKSLEYGSAQIIFQRQDLPINRR